MTPAPEPLYIGLMSGTSIDAVDSALLRLPGEDQVELLHTCEYPIPDATRERIANISHPGPDEIEQLGRLDRELGKLFANAALALLGKSGLDATKIRAIGSHGQTVRHRPPSGGEAGSSAFTLQIGDPNTIAELTGITTVADFRRRDMAAGGEGAPLAPAFHAAALSHTSANRAVVNIGGIANVSILTARHLHSGFDTGPGNTLLDQWHARHRGQLFDRDGAWSAEGNVATALLDRLLQHPYFDKKGPRSTGKEVFNLPWLEQQLAATGAVSPADVQATLAELTARSIARAIKDSGVAVEAVYICGGGAHNSDLGARLRRLLAPLAVETTAALGIDPDWVEAATFAWLAHRRLEGLCGNAPAVTGAAGQRILGGVFPA